MEEIVEFLPLGAAVIWFALSVSFLIWSTDSLCRLQSLNYQETLEEHWYHE